MKTKTLIALLFCVTNLFAQTNFYTETKVFNKEEYSYQCNVSPRGNVTLYNASNCWIGIEQKFKETNERFDNEDNELDLTTYESWLQYRNEFYKIMNSLDNLNIYTTIFFINTN